SGPMFCWGANDFGQLGDGDSLGHAGHPVPIPVIGNLQFTAITADDDATCALTAQGAAYCWGLSFQQAGAFIGPPPNFSPAPVGNGTPLRAIATNAQSACGLTTGGSAVCWGWSYYAGNGYPYYPGNQPGFYPLPVAVAPPGYTIPNGYGFDRHR
ncbi:MAG TPA: hypothetical protein VK733_11555, partial [Gemmatimonadaceae bacterium]|nr:hypothetical protein [Gemmatimonadaceae bacterium]